MKIAQDIKTDKKAYSVIKVRIMKTRVILTYNNLELNLSHVEAKRLAGVLSKGVAIQETENE